MFDIAFISYDEPNADDNWNHLTIIMPYDFVRRVHGVKGILNAHIEAASISRTSYFFVVDGDNQVLPNFDFQFDAVEQEPRTYAWRSLNPVNGLVYGHGGIKLLHRQTMLENKEMNIDMTTSLTKNKFEAVGVFASTNMFNSSPFAAYRSAFRECVKLSAKTIMGQNDLETNDRLHTWLNVYNDVSYADFVRRGAHEGNKYGLKHRGNEQALEMINDFDWLRERFENI